jgi:predicted DNA-binding WGR domain protein
MTKRRFELVEGRASKFWEVSIEGNEVRTSYGKIGARGQTTVKDEGSPEAASRLYEKLVKEKTKKGYVEVGAAPESSARATPSSAEAPTIANPSAKLPVASFDVFARLAALGAVEATDEDGDELLGLADIEALASVKWREHHRGTIAALLGRELPANSVVPLVKGGGGSLVLGWQLDETSPMRAVWLDSEGDPREVFAASMEEMFTLLPHGLGYLYDCIKSAERGTPLDRESGCDVAAWSEAGFPPHPTPGRAVHAALRSSPRFSAWLEGEAGGGSGGGATMDEADADSGGNGDDSDARWRRFEMEEKFWAIQLEGRRHTVRYGKIGTNGQQKSKDFDDEDAARKDHARLVAEKTKKGYRPVE